ncbi:hypothetical protein MMC07_004064 [Pseudocyphellaria aurata]|nr:hypothetical protein [Pseudocyphellaria aurata]
MSDPGVLDDVTNALKKTSVSNEDAVTHPRDLGWAEPLKYDYEAYNASSKPREERAAIEEAKNLPPWAANAQKYEWSDEFGDVGPRHDALEEILFNNEYINRTGIAFDKIAGITVTFESTSQIQPALKFEDAGLHPVMLENIKLCRYELPTPIQAYCLPSILKGLDIVAVAQTGSGKTAAFLIPTISKLMGKVKRLAAPRPDLTRPYISAVNGVRAEPLILVVAPTRELATQIFDEARRLCYRSMLRPCVIYGGAPAGEQVEELRKGCDVLIATPGRLIDFMERMNLLSLSRVKFTIIDEADEMVSSDWAEDMQTIMGGGDSNVDADHVYMMFSATFPKEARVVAKEYMSADHIRIRVGRVGSSHVNVTQKIVYADESMKRTCLYDLLMSMPPSRTMVFVNNKRGADALDDFLFNKGLPSSSIHADRTQLEREDAIRAFKSGKAPVLVATGVSARGLDIKNVMHVVNYDLPSAQYGGIQDYVHRIGRTARIGNVGLATSFYNNANEDIAEALVKVLLETGQEVPDFLEAFKPEDTTKIDFNDDSDDEDHESEKDGANGASNGDSGANNGTSENGWNDAPAGSKAEETTDTWATPTPAPAAKSNDDWQGEQGDGGW